ncbi:hypothetical protein BJ508DRAFT_328222 [Ascobolus immersus RN42]|uniref:Uncharacterized protein n=1 Tax=Ascobolus immersus RN42 TaxID=1160509 RepID=A0A3N4I5W8_ASCIM|nr:hypothetical protein BJ508DRAFT_328222 [Ascobolus immersus RN42]
MTPDKSFNPRCRWCKVDFDDPSDKELHSLSVHHNKVLNAYNNETDTELDVNVFRSANYRFHCAVEGCNYSEIDQRAFKKHCADHPQPLVFKPQVLSAAIELNPTGHSFVKYQYQCELALPEASSQRSSVETTSKDDDSEKAPPNTSHKSSEETPSVHESAPTEPERVAASVTINTSPQPEQTPTPAPEAASITITPARSTAARSRKSTKQPATKASVEAHTMMRRSSTTMTPQLPVTPQLKRKAENSEIDEMKATLRAKYQKNLFEETMMAMEDLNADLDESDRKKERMTAYFKKSMDMLDKLGDGI